MAGRRNNNRDSVLVGKLLKSKSGRHYIVSSGDYLKRVAKLIYGVAKKGGACVFFINESSKGGRIMTMIESDEKYSKKGRGGRGGYSKPRDDFDDDLDDGPSGLDDPDDDDDDDGAPWDDVDDL